MTPRTHTVRACVETILRCFHESRDAGEREAMAKELARLDAGGARLALADLAEAALREQP